MIVGKQILWGEKKYWVPTRGTVDIIIAVHATSFFLILSLFTSGVHVSLNLASTHSFLPVKIYIGCISLGNKNHLIIIFILFLLLG